MAIGWISHGINDYQATHQQLHLIDRLWFYFTLVPTTHLILLTSTPRWMETTMVMIRSSIIKYPQVSTCAHFRFPGVSDGSDLNINLISLS